MIATHAVPWLATLLATAGGATQARPGPAVVVDACESAAPWSAVPADGVDLKIGTDAGADGRALRLDFDFRGGGGYAVAHRAVSLDLPANYCFTFRVRGECRPNNLEFKLVDASGENVWWSNQRDFEFPREWRTVALKARQLSFAWGPLGGGRPGHVAALEMAVTAGQGGKGSVWIDDLRLQALPPPDTTRRAVTASASSGGGSAHAAVDGDASTAWTSAPRDPEPWLRLDLGAEREFGGLVIDWARGRQARDYVVELSSDGRTWQTARTVTGGNGGRDYLDLPESQARWVRIRATRTVDPAGVIAIVDAVVEPLEWAATPARFYEAIARDAPRGRYPRAMRGENVFWTVVGQDFDTAEGLIDESGRIETGKGAFSIEPFVRTRGRLLTWNDVQTSTALRDGYLPMPSVQWTAGDLRLAVSAFAVGAPEHSAIIARYRLSNLGPAARRDTLFLALRPFQVNPPTQFLNTPGGVADIHELSQEGRVVRVNADRGLETLTPPAAFGAARFEQGDIVEYLAEGRLPAAVRMPDPSGRASGALAYALNLPAGGAREVALLIPLHDPLVEPPVPPADSLVGMYVDALERGAGTQWHARLDRVSIQLPDSDIVYALMAQLAWVLVNRSGPAIQPGARSYARSWIRDGCLTSSALLRLGETEAVRRFIEWFAPHQYPTGKVPCCVDARGADPVPEHDSSGELIYLIAEYVRYTGDRALAERMWPHVAAAAAWLDTLRAQRRTPEWRTPENAPFFGILPPSISHEGYSAKPMHSYWDDFFALRGFKDAAFLADLLGRPERAALERDRDEFQHDLVASLRAAMKAKGIDYLPGCADLGDFDATSTSIGLSPANAAGVLPAGALERTYEKYWDFFVKRRDGMAPWEAFTPYEWRNVGAMVRLGWRDRANEALQWLMQYRRPPGFQHWAEVVWHDERAPHFIGDMPHTWVGPDYVRSVLDLLAYEREADSTLVVGGGVPAAWLAGKGVAVKGLKTHWGSLSFTLRGTGREGIAVLESPDFRMPPGGIVLMPPGGPREGFRVRALPAGTPVSVRWR